MDFIQIKHHGAVNGVTGSCHELRFKDGAGVLIDCGLFQGAETSGQGADSKQLAAKLLEIAESSNPKLVYREGMFIQKFLVGLLNYLPNRLVQKILMDTYGI